MPGVLDTQEVEAGELFEPRIPGFKISLGHTTRLSFKKKKKKKGNTIKSKDTLGLLSTA
jgi:hypothetical protein